MNRCIISMTVVATLVLAMSTWTVSTSGAATSKPAGDRIGADLHTLTWGFPLVDPGTHRGKAIVITNTQIVAKVRTLIDSLPDTVPNPHRMCPMDVVVSPHWRSPRRGEVRWSLASSSNLVAVRTRRSTNSVDPSHRPWVLRDSARFFTRSNISSILEVSLSTNLARQGPLAAGHRANDVENFSPVRYLGG